MKNQHVPDPREMFNTHQLSSLSHFETPKPGFPCPAEICCESAEATMSCQDANRRVCTEVCCGMVTDCGKPADRAAAAQHKPGKEHPTARVT